MCQMQELLAAGLGSVESLPRIFLQEETLAQSPPNGKEPSYGTATLWAPQSGLRQIQLGLEASESKAVSRKRLSDTLDDKHLKCVLHWGVSQDIGLSWLKPGQLSVN